MRVTWGDFVKCLRGAASLILTIFLEILGSLDISAILGSFLSVGNSGKGVLPAFQMASGDESYMIFPTKMGCL
jgi:hypothetical protein